MVFTLAVQELLNIEQIFTISQQNHIYIYIYIYKEIAANSWYYWKALDEWDCLGVISSFKNLQ
jgi:hypothetical protein